jgi:hypothetical protein
MNKRLKLAGTIGLGIVFLAVALGYAFFQPFVPGAVCDAIPAQAPVVYRADHLADLLKSPVCGQLDKALGAGRSLKALTASNRWLRGVVPSELAVANLPPRYAGQTRPWVAVSWVGWRSPWLRWRLEQTHAEGLSRLEKHSVWPVWKYEMPDIARGANLTFALTDNLFITCLSDDPADILFLLDTYDNRILSAND